MAKLTLQDLRALREKQRATMQQRDVDGKETEILVGMGTCGIAAGARTTFDALIDELNRQGLSNVVVKQTGCMGLCYSEPTIEVHMPGMPDIIYGRIDEKLARQVVSDHIMKRALLSDHIFDKPAADIVK